MSSSEEPEQRIPFVCLETAGSFIKHYAFNMSKSVERKKEVAELT
ncbi:hypothetical protein F444_07038 [Phytophthora nicotianae P1976]|uniref:Uncharacterized protein n=1 Tax=Phytophthora nicotianae P1976 TaxID=1317066 RepID=A0A081AG22_PHYNI|nr:hypothetical protein F444_07038 [Phytophthora nicotianae P1976]